MRRDLGCGSLEESIETLSAAAIPFAEADERAQVCGLFRLECAQDIWILETGIGIHTGVGYEIVAYTDIQYVEAGGPKSERPSSFLVVLKSGREIRVLADCGDDPKISFAYSWLSFLARVCSDVQGRSVVAILPPE